MSKYTREEWFEARYEELVSMTTFAEDARRMMLFSLWGDWVKYHESLLGDGHPVYLQFLVAREFYSLAPFDLVGLARHPIECGSPAMDQAMFDELAKLK